MRVVIQNSKTRQFYRRPGIWTDKKEQADEFPNSYAARQICKQLGVSHCDIVLAFEESQFDVFLPCS